MTSEESIAELIEESKRLREQLMGTAAKLESFSRKLTQQAERLTAAVSAPQEGPDDGAR